MQDHADIVVIAAVTLACMASAVYGYYGGPEIAAQPGIAYATGNDRAVLARADAEFNLHVASTGETALAIYDLMGNAVLAAEAGPIFYASLPAGKYIVVAEKDGARQKKLVKLFANGASNLTFAW